MFSSNASQVSSDANFIEDVFSTYLYTGNNSARTITNEIDLAGKGGLVWIKTRSASARHCLFDTSRGVGKVLSSDLTFGSIDTEGGDLTAFNSNGFSLGTSIYGTNDNGLNYASWTFRKQPKFFDVVTWTGNDVNGRTISHSLDSVPGTVIVKCTSDATTWTVYHRSLGATKYLGLEETSAAFTSSLPWNNTEPTSTNFSVGTSTWTNATGRTYVAYLFAHDAGGFGLSGTENVVSCGSYVGNASATGPVVTLGYEPQWLLVKAASGTGNWYLVDNMRGLPVGLDDPRLFANLSSSEATSFVCSPTATGFQVENGFLNNSGVSFIYIAIRRGPMKVPTDGTKVFAPLTWTGNDTARKITGTGSPPDLTFIRDRSDVTGYGFVVNDKLRGSSNVLRTWATDAETAAINQGITSFDMRGVSLGTDASNYGYNRSSNPEIGLFFTRAPGFFDEVCREGGGTNTPHSLIVIPELIISKKRSAAQGWQINCNTSGLGWKQGAFTNAALYYPGDNSPYISATTFDMNVFTSNNAGNTYVVYLFATCPGVSKVGSYTGTGTTQAIACGFAAGARFVMIKRTDAAGDWYVWDSARGIVTGNDPYLLLNTADAEVTGTDYIDPSSAGFEISSTAPAAINASGGSYIFLAVA